MTNDACSLTVTDRSERLQEWRSISGSLLGQRVTAGGAELRYRFDSSVGATLARLIEAERRCCASLSFEATVVVAIDAPPSMRAWVEETFGRAAADVGAEGGDRKGGGRDQIENAVRSHYAAAAKAALASSSSGSDCERETAGIGPSVYGPATFDALPEGIAEVSIGCANPLAVAHLAEGEKVLDLGSGGGIDVLLSAQRVGPAGKAYGLDMTDEMLELARANQARAGIENAEFLPGRIEAVPLPDASVDVVLSNCVVGLSTDKRAVFAEAYRVIRPGGRLAIADVVADVEATSQQRQDSANWVTCAAGALTRSQYRTVLADAGFRDVILEDSHPVGNGLTSVVVRARKLV